MKSPDIAAIREEAGAAPAPLRVTSLTVAYESAGRHIIALRDVDLELRCGEVMGLVGPNGSGKTTLIRAATGGLRPQSGSVFHQGKDIGTLTARDIALRVSVVPQSPMLPDGFTALECVLMGRTPHLRLLENEGAADIEIARPAMLATETWPLASRPIGDLSGGERQRVLVARALAQDTPALLLDEPTAHLDIGHQASVLRLMRSLAASEGKAILAVIHDLTLAARFCDRLVLLHAGEVVADGAPGDVLRADLLRRVYDASVDVFPHPRTGRPVVAPGSDEA